MYIYIYTFHCFMSSCFDLEDVYFSFCIYLVVLFIVYICSYSYIYVYFQFLFKKWVLSFFLSWYRFLYFDIIYGIFMYSWFFCTFWERCWFCYSPGLSLRRFIHLYLCWEFIFFALLLVDRFYALFGDLSGLLTACWFESAYEVWGSFVYIR